MKWQLALIKRPSALIKWPSALIKWQLALIKRPSGLKMLFLPADKFFIRGHMNLAIRGPNLGDLAIGLPFRPPDKSVPALQSFPYKARRAHDEIVEAVACAMAPNARDEIAEAAP